MDPVPPLAHAPAERAAAHVLVVDDEEQVRRLLVRLLERGGYSCVSAGDAAEARAHLGAQDFAVMVCDVNLDGESGIDLVRDTVEAHHGTAAIMVTGTDDRALAEEAMAGGAYGYVLKPFRGSELLFSVDAAVRRSLGAAEDRRYRERLEEAVAERTGELRVAVRALERSHEELRKSQVETIRRLMKALDYRNEETGGHIERVSETCASVAAALGLQEAHCDLLRTAAAMHDVGKIAIPDRVLLKPGRLTASERAEMELHTEIGHGILSGSGSELLDLAARIALTHHERYDGAGYPNGLAGEEIPLEGRIAAVSDVYDALTSDRVYRSAMPQGEALGIMRAGRGRHFDPEVFDAFIMSLGTIEERLHVGAGA